MSKLEPIAIRLFYSQLPSTATETIKSKLAASNSDDAITEEEDVNLREAIVEYSTRYGVHVLLCELQTFLTVSPGTKMRTSS